MKDRFRTRMGDGELVSLSTAEAKDDILAGSKDAAARADIPELTEDDVRHLLDILTEPSKVVSVAPGQEVIVTDDGCSMSFYAGQDSGGIGIPMSRLQAIPKGCGPNLRFRNY